MKIDGRKKIDCTIGSSLDGELLVYAVNIFPEDDTIEVIAVNADGEEVGVDPDVATIDDPRVITDESLEPVGVEQTGDATEENMRV